MHPKRSASTAEFEPPPCEASAGPPQPFSSRVRVDFGALSHPGKVRPNNEDHYLVARFGRALDVLLTNVPAGGVPAHFEEAGYGMAVADGMGGSAAGEVASRMAICAGIYLALHRDTWYLRIDSPSVQQVLERLLDSLRKIDCTLTEQARCDRALAGMGTTLTAAYSVGLDLFLAHVGDSRAYLFRGGNLHQLTRDHTLAQSMADAGLIAPEDVPRHRLRHVLTRALGNQAGDVQADVQHLRLADGDRLLLCSDGLTDRVEDAAITEVLGRTKASSETCQTLVDLALDGGGRDNITVVLARYEMPR